MKNISRQQVMNNSLYLREPVCWVNKIFRCTSLFICNNKFKTLGIDLICYEKNVETIFTVIYPDKEKNTHST